jgi:hypothetical protein
LGQALGVARERGDRVAIVNTLLILSEVADRDGDSAGAELLASQALEQSRAHDDAWAIAFSAFHLARLARLHGDSERARGFAMQALAGWRRLDDAVALSHALDELGLLAYANRDYATAVRQFVVAEEVRAPTGGGPWLLSQAEREHALRDVRCHVGVGAFEAARHDARRLALDDLLARVGC